MKRNLKFCPDNILIPSWSLVGVFDGQSSFMDINFLIDFRKRLNADLEALSGKTKHSKFRKQSALIYVEMQQINRLIKKYE